MDNQVRVTGKKIDELQEVIRLLKDPKIVTLSRCSLST
jgi:uncharacterized protein YajQ (UPF0234 family)